MDISIERKSRGPALVAALGLILTSASLIFVTWSNLTRQREIIDRNMVLSAGVILRGVERGLFKMLDRQGLVDPREFQAMAVDLFRDMVETGDVRYLGVLAQNGSVLISSARTSERTMFRLPPEVIEAMRTKGSWQGMVATGNDQVLVLGIKAGQGFAGLSRPEAPRPGREQSASQEAYLVIGMGVDRFLKEYVDFRRAAVLQTGYILAAAGVLFVLSLAILNRRAQGARLIALERFHSKLLDTMPDGLISVSGEGVVQAANPAAHAILGWPPGTLVGSGLEALDLGLGQDVKGENNGRDWVQFDLGGKKLEIQQRLIGEGEHRERLVLLRDRTALKTLEERLAAAERLAAVGRMAAGVAHEIRNPLSSLRGFAQFFAKKFAGRLPEQEYAETMVREADRLNKVVSDMLFLSKPHPLNLSRISLPSIMDELLLLLKLELGAKQVAVKPDFAVVDIIADRDALKQALLNLLVNSLEAVPREAGEIVVGSEDAGEEVRVFVRDNGPGIAAEDLAKVLEPFYTTRAEGTGLGLSIVASIAREHGGRVAVDSRKGKGTMVSLFLPKQKNLS